MARRYEAPEAIRGAWEELLYDYGFEEAPSFGHVTEALLTSLGLERKELVRLICEWATESGGGVSPETARAWLRGGWTEDAAALAVWGLGKTLEDPERRVKACRLAAGADGGERLDPRSLAFELCMYGEPDGGERGRLLINAAYALTLLDNSQLESLGRFLSDTSYRLARERGQAEPGFLDPFDFDESSRNVSSLRVRYGRVSDELGKAGEWLDRAEKARLEKKDETADLDELLNRPPKR